MTILEMQERKRELGYSNETLSQLSGIPLSTVQKILGGRTRAPRSATIKALEAVLSVPSRGEPYRFPEMKGASGLEEGVFSYGAPRGEGGARKGPLPGEAETECIQGEVTYLAPPTRLHQEIVTEVLFALLKRIREGNINGAGEAALEGKASGAEETALEGKASGAEKIAQASSQEDLSFWRVYPAPFPVYPEGERGGTFLEPDLSLVCSQEKLKEQGCIGAPDWVMEVTSPQTISRDYGGKLFLYRSAGVKEYWIVHPEKRMVTVYRFEEDPEEVQMYSFEEEIPFPFLPGFGIRLEDLLR